MPKADRPEIGAVVIGRNEGARLVRCLESLRAAMGDGRIVYVDSGSSDGSVQAALTRGAEVVELDPNVPFTAARARNEGFARLMEGEAPGLVQFVDGDCELRAGWLEAATRWMERHPAAAVVCGRRRERFPDATVWNRMCDVEWDTPVGLARACGGDALMRCAALARVGGFNPAVIAGEEPELCVRLRALGYEIWRIDAEMTLHDAAMTRFGQFWQRARRAGHAWAEGAAMHGAAPERHSLPGLLRALVWGLALPLAALAGWALAGPWALLLLALYPLQVLRLARRFGGDRFAWQRAGLLTISKFAEVQGVLGYLLRRLRQGPPRTIDYK